MSGIFEALRQRYLANVDEAAHRLKLAQLVHHHLIRLLKSANREMVSNSERALFARTNNANREIVSDGEQQTNLGRINAIYSRKRRQKQ